MTVLEEGLELVPRPYARIGMRCGMAEDDVLDTLARWLRDGILKRFGVVVHHHELGFRANAMCVWNVPDDRVRNWVWRSPPSTGSRCATGVPAPAMTGRSTSTA